MCDRTRRLLNKDIRERGSHFQGHTCHLFQKSSLMIGTDHLNF